MHRLLLLLVIGCAISVDVHGQTPDANPAITANEIRTHIIFLASDSLGGRKTGEEGNRIAASYIANEFRRYGLEPKGDQGTFLQSFQVTTGIKAGTGNALEATINNRKLNYAADVDVRPVAITSSATAEGDLVFVGYGISSDSLKLDEYAGVDVKGKIVMMLRFTPDFGKQNSIYDGWEFLYKKGRVARDKGAAGILIVTGPADEEKPELMPLKFERRNEDVGVPVMNITSTAATELLRSAGIAKNLKEIQQQIYDTKSPASFMVPGVSVSMTTNVERVASPSANVVGLIEGTSAKEEVMIIGAHFDHLGWGGAGSGSLKAETTAIHHGADDNASGTAGILELAQYFSAHRDSLKRSLLFIGFSGEEMGLLGSQYYVNHPSLPLAQTVAMVNLDMIGRMRESTLVVEGSGTSPAWASILKRHENGFKLKLKPGGFGPSDHSSFYGKKIPVLFFFTNLHEDYHRPSDTWEKIQFWEEQRVLTLVADITKEIVNGPTRPEYVQVTDSSATIAGDRRETRVSLGVMPDYAEDIVGLKITGTRPGSSAEKAGLVGGDIIVKFAGKDVKNIYDFTYLMGERKPGEEVQIVVKRGAEELTLTATLQARKQ